jgi:hypothetical protein
MYTNKLASAIYNDIVSGLSGITSNPNISMESLEDDVVHERLQIIKEYSIKNLLPKKDLLIAINCIDVDCKSLDKCCNSTNYSAPVAHFEIPQLLNDFGDEAIEFIGSTDKSIRFKYYTNLAFKYHTKKMRGGDKPFVYIETTPNENNMYDVFVYNAPFLKRVSVIAIFKDLRQVENYSCCNEEMENFTFIDAEIKKRLTEKKLRYYRSLVAQPQPNNQVAR